MEMVFGPHNIFNVCLDVLSWHLKTLSVHRGAWNLLQDELTNQTKLLQQVAVMQIFRIKYHHKHHESKKTKTKTL